MKLEKPHQLALAPVGERSWRLCDRTAPRYDAASVVAYVELTADGVYEVVWRSVGFGVSRYSSLEALQRSAMDMMSRSRSSGSLKPDPIPHRPPPRA